MGMAQLLAVVILVVVVIGIVKLVRIVPQGYEWTVETFGKYTGTLTPGLHFLIPIYQAIGHKMNMMGRCWTCPRRT